MPNADDHVHQERDFHDAEVADRRFSLVWLVPVVALIVSLAVAWKTHSERGPLVSIIFDSASGVEVGKTIIKHRDVKVGTVEDVGFTDDGTQVLVTARIDKEVAKFIDADAQFWVVSPQVSLEGISGLETVLSGSYIEAAWDTQIGETAYSFTALKEPPLTPPDQPGRRVRLIAEDGGSVGIGAPVFYKRIQVGRVESKTLTPDGESVVFDLFIEDPHHLRLSAGSRFWNASGIEVELGAEGAKLKVESLISLLRGGITFDNVAFGGGPVQEDRLFRLFETEKTARASIFDDDYSAQIRLSVAFNGSVRGLAVGAPVELRGYKVGEVIDVIASIDDSSGRPEVSLITTILLQPSRLGLPSGEAEDSLNFIKTLVKNGMRAKLASASIITGALYIELVQGDRLAEEEIDETASPYPRLPSVASDLDDLAASAEGMITRINNLPIEELLDAATTLMGSINVIVADEKTRSLPTEVAGLLADTRRLVSAPELADAGADLAGTLAGARAIVDGLNEADVAGSFTQALDAATATATSIQLAAERAPELMANLTRFAGNAASLPLNDLITTATDFVRDAQTFVGSDSFTALPADLSSALTEVQSLLAQLREEDAAKNLAIALASAGEAATSIKAAAEAAPTMMANFASLSEKAEALPLDQLIAAAQNVLEDVSALVTSEGLRETPDTLNDTLIAVQGLLTDIREAETTGRLATALDEVGRAAVSAQTLVGSVDGLVNSESLQQTPGTLNDTLLAVQGLLGDIEAAETTRRLAVALDEASRTAATITAAAAEIPDALQQIEALAATLRVLPLDQVIASANRLINDLDRIATAPGAEQIPGAVVAAFDQVRVAVSDLQARNVPENFNNALVSFNGASIAFQGLSANLNALMPQISAVATRADSVLGSLDVGSELNYEAITTIREIRDAARAITALVATIERKPNSLILGK